MSTKISGNLLIVGGDKNLEDLVPILETSGLRVRRSQDVYAALASFEEERADWILLELSGLEEEDLQLIPTLQRLAPEVPVFLSLALEHRETAARALELGAHAYLLRPFYPAELLSLIRNSHRMQEARGSFDDLEALAGGVAHEINNPLTIVTGWIQMLLRKSEEDSREKKALEVMRKECDRIASVVSDLQLVGTRFSLERQPTHLAKLIKDTAAELEAEGSLHHLQVDLDVPHDLPPVDLDMAQIGRTIKEIIRNAVAATTAPDGRLRVEVTPQANCQILRFIDNGRGIRPENLGRVILPFFTEGSKEGRRGVGLALARAIIAGHGGTLAIASDVGQGTTVTVTLPILGMPRPDPGPPLLMSHQEKNDSPKAPTTTGRSET